MARVFTRNIKSPPWGPINKDTVDPRVKKFWSGLQILVPFWEGGGNTFTQGRFDAPRDVSPYGRSIITEDTAHEFPTWVQTEWGPTIQYGDADDANCFMVNDEPTLLAGLSSFTLLGVFDADSDFKTTDDQMLGLGHWDASENTLLNRLETDNEVRCIVNMSGSDADLTVNHTFVVPGLNALVWRLTNSVLECFINGEQVAGSDAGAGTFAYTGGVADLEIFGEDTGSHNTLFKGRPQMVAAWDHALSASEIAELHNLGYFGLVAPARGIWGPTVAAPAAGAGAPYYSMYYRRMIAA